MKRFALVFALVVVLGSIGARTAGATAIGDTPCPPTDVSWADAKVFICPEGTVGSAYSIQLTGRSGCVPYKWHLLSGALPAGLSLSSDGAITGTPTTAGEARFWIEMNDVGCPNDIGSTQRQFSLTIQPRVIITTQSAPGGTVGTAYNLPLQAQMMSAPGQFFAPSSPIAWSFTGDLPPGLALDAGTGVLSGTPTASGAYLATFTAALSDGRSDTKALQIVVRDPLAIAPLGLHPWGLHGSEVGIAISRKLTATGGSGTFTWTLATGSLPTGVALHADGTIAGKPKASGKFPFSIQVADTEGRTATVNATLTVAAKLSFKTITLRAAKSGRLYNATLKTLGGVSPVKWKVLSGKLPRGIRFAKTLGTFSGTAKRAGTYRVSVQVTDSLGVTAKKTFVLVVKP